MSVYSVHCVNNISNTDSTFIRSDGFLTPDYGKSGASRFLKNWMVTFGTVKNSKHEKSDVGQLFKNWTTTNGKMKNSRHSRKRYSLISFNHESQNDVPKHWDTDITTKEAVGVLSQGPMSLGFVLNWDREQQDCGRITRNRDSGVSNELRNREILVERKRWHHIDVHQLRGIKVSKRNLTPARPLSAASSFLRRSLRSTASYKTDVYGSRSFYDDDAIRKFKRDTKKTENNLAKGRKRPLPSLEEVYKRLTTLDVVFYLPLNMTLNVSDSNSTSDGMEKCMTLLNELYRDVEGKLFFSIMIITIIIIIIIVIIILDYGRNVLGKVNQYNRLLSLMSLS